jgi:hypothetical protein
MARLSKEREFAENLLSTLIQNFDGVDPYDADEAEAIHRVIEMNARQLLESELATQKARSAPDFSPGEVISAEVDGTIVLDDGITTWNPTQACEFLLAAQKAQTAAMREVCAEILEIMNTYHKQFPNIDTPGGFEHLGDVWSRFLIWERQLRKEPQ